MKNYYKLILLIPCILFFGNINAQINGEIETIPKYTIAMQLTLTSDGPRLVFEKQLDKPTKWLQLYLGGCSFRYQGADADYQYQTFGSDFDPINALKSFEVGGAYKSFFYKNLIYYSAGLSYSYSKVTYIESGYFGYLEDGLTFYEYQETDIKQSFNKIFPSVCLGIQSKLSNTIFVDFYGGLAYSASFYDKDKYAFDRTIFGYGYRGVTLTAGFRFGVAFGK